MYIVYICHLDVVGDILADACTRCNTVLCIAYIKYYGLQVSSVSYLCTHEWQVTLKVTLIVSRHLCFGGGEEISLTPTHSKHWKRHPKCCPHTYVVCKPNHELHCNMGIHLP